MHRIAWRYQIDAMVSAVLDCHRADGRCFENCLNGWGFLVVQHAGILDAHEFQVTFITAHRFVRVNVMDAVLVVVALEIGGSKTNASPKLSAVGIAIAADEHELITPLALVPMAV